MAEENYKVSKCSGLQAASFGDIQKTSIAVIMIIELLVNNIKNETRINKEDILDLYVSYRIKRGLKLRKRIWRGYIANKYEYKICTPDEYKNIYGMKWQAVNWFKSQLGSAIIQGKLLAIPVIDI